MGRSISDHRRTDKKNNFNQTQRDKTEPRKPKRDAYEQHKRNARRADLKREWW